MGNVLPADHIIPAAPSAFDWNYATYLGDGIPLLFWIWVYPYQSCGAANDYKWNIYTNSQATPFVFNNTDNGANSLLKFPATNAYSSSILTSAFNGSTLGPYRGNYAFILVDSPWARSCQNRVATSEADKNKNYAVGVSANMLQRIASTYNTWDKWFNTQNYPGLGGLSTCTPGGTNQSRSLIPTYLKQALITATNNAVNGGVQLFDIAYFTPKPNGYNFNEDQAGVILPEINNVEVSVTATQCAIDNLYQPVNPFSKTFFGSFVAIYKDYEVQDTIINNSLMINVPWSGMLTGPGRDIDYPDYGPIPENNIYKMNVPLAGNQCTLSCPQDLTFYSLFDVFYQDKVSSPYNYIDCYNGFLGQFNFFGAGYSAPFTFPRLAARNQFSVHVDPIFGDVFNSNIFNDGIGLNPCLYANGTEAYSYVLRNGSIPAIYYQDLDAPWFDPIPVVAPWHIIYKMSPITRQLVAGGGCSNSIMNLFP